MTDLERALDDMEARICAVGVKHGLNIHPVIARDIASYLQEGLEDQYTMGQAYERAKFILDGGAALAEARREGAAEMRERAAEILRRNGYHGAAEMLVAALPLIHAGTPPMQQMPTQLGKGGKKILQAIAAIRDQGDEP